MQKLIAELSRLYLLPGQQRYRLDDAGADQAAAGALSPALLEQHLRGALTVSIELASADGQARALVMEFIGKTETQRARHWDTLCLVANAMQEQLGLPAPAVSISGANGFGLWMSLETAVPVAQAQRFLRLLRAAYSPELENDEITLRPDDGAQALAQDRAELPPCLNRSSQKWSAFINPGMGASFAEEPGLEMSPPPAAQAAFLEGLHSIGAAQFAQAMRTLQPQSQAATAATLAPASTALPAGLLLRDATLEDIVRLLHERNIEPTFRHLIAK
ncbi:hypothetical protein [Rugamonas sp.]|uniref:hypothetical protein n=1 Tax=Rugamonas sp. TaxID=1926287 RepID=UPI0025F8BC07|nr:hypothetical protein [Rugamonas sp.]